MSAVSVRVVVSPARSDSTDASGNEVPDVNVAERCGMYLTKPNLTIPKEEGSKRQI